MKNEYSYGPRAGAILCGAFRRRALKARQKP